jgi:hypothetical protein
VEVVSSLDEAYAALGGREGIEVWVTAARNLGRETTMEAAREALAAPGKPVLLVFGTGWGLDASVTDAADAVLSPIHAAAAKGYNHLSVRAACAIALDRLLGERN